MSYCSVAMISQMLWLVKDVRHRCDGSATRLLGGRFVWADRLWSRVPVDCGHPASRKTARRGAPGFSKSARFGVPLLFRSMLKGKPALYFPVKVAHPPQEG